MWHGAVLWLDYVCRQTVRVGDRHDAIDCVAKFHRSSGLLPTDTATVQVESAKELIRLVKLGFLPTDAVISQRKASKEQSRLVKLALLPYDATASQNKAVEELS